MNEKQIIHIQQKREGEFSDNLGFYIYPQGDEWIHLFKNYAIISCFNLELPEIFNPNDVKGGLLIHRKTNNMNNKIEIHENLFHLYGLIKDDYSNYSKLKTPRTKKTIENSLFESLKNCLNIGSKEHESPPNLIVEQFPDENYEPVSEPETKSYLSTGYKDPEKEKKIKTIKELVENLDVKNSDINLLLRKWAESKPS